MIQDFIDFLNDQNPDADAIQQALRYYLAEITEDMSTDDMRKELVSVVGDGKKLESLIDQLNDDPITIQDASLIFLSSEWLLKSDHSQIKSAIEDAKESLPVIEVGMLTIAAMYAMYLIKTNGIDVITHYIKRNPDGSFEKTDSIKYASPVGPLQTIVDLITKSLPSKK